MSDTLHLRCSKLPIAFKCPGSVRREGILVDEDGDAARLGRAAHDGLAVLVDTGRIDWESVPELAKRHDVNEPELRALLGMGAKLWEQVKDSIPKRLSEVAMRHRLGSIELTGHSDILGHSAQSAHVLDWKTGRKDADYSEQLRGYAALALFEDDMLLSATAGILWVRDGEYEHYTMDRSGLLQWVVRVENEIVKWDGTFRPGSHCEYCPRSHECVAANALARRDMAVILDHDLPGHLEDAETIREMRQKDPGKLIRLAKLARTAQHQAERALAALKAEALRGGDIESDGERITIESNEERKLKVLPTFEILEEQDFTNEELAEALSISVTKLEKIVAKRAGKGKGAAAVRELSEKLAKAGAVEKQPVTKMILRRA